MPGEIIATPTTSAEARTGFRWLETVDEAFEVMLPAIDAATTSIRLEVYIYRVSPVGETLRDALIRACQRRVKVQVLIDALGSISLPEKFWDPFIQAGGEFRWFNPLKLKRLGFRNHRKLLVIDDKIGFVGGFNVAPEYQGDGVTKGWHDLGLQVPASLTKELANSFDTMFGMADYRHRRLARYRRSRIARLAETPDGQLLTNAPGRGEHVMKGTLLQDIHRSGTVDIISAYFLPPRQMRRAMMRASRSGRPVRLILAGKSDVKLSQLASRYLYKSLLRAGVQIYEYQPQILHTKLYLFDDIFYVGSANMDKRSLMVNYELLVRVKHHELAEYGRNFFSRTLTNCTQITLAQWRATHNVWSRFKEQWAYFVLSKLDPYLTQIQLEVLYREMEHGAPESSTPPGLARISRD
ncbi:MAG TPA: phosphatidylserine/phosphatidylglycerophosphate/cardiolipin synthase family protein [Candidatus Kapabacteria bacterium]|nr:phosphatidylserine/phosphatidylglycerophosphate/cardiolipin synthase family protein [Candidatus Kapabacteria bacterium]